MFRESPGCSLVMCVRHCKLNNCSREKNVNGQITDGGCHINFDTQLKRKTLGPAHTKRNGCTRTMRRTEGFYRCKRCWLKLLTLTALALKEMKKSRGIEEGEKSQKARRRRRNKKRWERRGKGRIKARILSILPLPLLSVFIFALRLCHLVYLWLLCLSLCQADHDCAQMWFAF